MTLGCKEVGMRCSFTASGKTVGEVKERLMSHANTVHYKELNAMSLDEIKRMRRHMDNMLAAQKRK